MNKIQKIAKKVFSRSQMTKRCKIVNDVFVGEIQQAIFLQQNNYTFLNFTDDIYGFFYDVKREFDDIGFADKIDIDDVKLKVEENQLLSFTYRLKTKINEQQKQKIKTCEWTVL